MLLVLYLINHINIYQQWPLSQAIAFTYSTHIWMGESLRKIVLQKVVEQDREICQLKSMLFVDLEWLVISELILKEFKSRKQINSAYIVTDSTVKSKARKYNTLQCKENMQRI